MEKLKFEIKPLTREKYYEFENVCAVNFGGEIKDYPTLMPDKNQVSDKDINECIMAVNKENKLVGTLSIIPKQWVVEDGEFSVTLNTSGIGGVTCLKEARGQGVMSLLLNRSIEIMNESESEISWLQGDRFRYGHYGWEFCGNNISYYFDKRIFEKYVKGKNIENHTVRKVTELDHNTIYNLYKNLPSYIIRDKENWDNHFTHEDLEWYISYNKNKEKVAYLCYNKKKNIVTEVFGDFNCVLICINNIFATNNSLNDLWVNFPVCNNELAIKLHSIACDFKISKVANVKILKVDNLFNKLKIFVDKQFKENNVAKTEFSENEKLRICERLLAFVHTPVKNGDEFDFVKPLVFWLPVCDDV